MLYNPKWEGPTLAGFIGWLEQQSADRPYDYWPCPTCAIGKYLRAIGKDEMDLPRDGTYSDWNTHIARPLPWTFGAALKRARAFAAA